MARFPIDEGIFLTFREWLTSIDGGKKKGNRAVAIATDVSKYLRDANPENVKWSMLLDRSKLIKYCKSLEDLMTCSGIVQKLESIDDGLRYMKAEGKGDSHVISNIRESMKVWRQKRRWLRIYLLARRGGRTRDTFLWTM